MLRQFTIIIKTYDWLVEYNVMMIRLITENNFLLNIIIINIVLTIEFLEIPRD